MGNFGLENGRSGPKMGNFSLARGLDVSRKWANLGWLGAARLARGWLGASQGWLGPKMGNFGLEKGRSGLKMGNFGLARGLESIFTHLGRIRRL